MRITQHEENRGEGTEGRRRGEGRKERGAKVRYSVEEKEIKEKKRKSETVDTVRSPFPIPFRLTPGRFLEFVNSGVEEMNMEPRGPDSSTRLAHNLHLLNVCLVSWFVF